MLTDGVKLLSGSAENFVIKNGASLPVGTRPTGEVFYKTGADFGLYVYNSTGWAAVGAELAGGNENDINIVYLTDAQTLTNKTITGLLETKVAMSANDIDVKAGAVFTKTITAASTLTISNVPPAGKVASFILRLKNGGSKVVKWWPNVKWEEGTAPVLTTAGTDNLGFYTDDGGATWQGFLLSADSK